MGPTLHLAGRRVVITGGASGIGLATANRFADEGARVVTLDVDKDASARTLRDNPRLVDAVNADVSDPESVETAFTQVDEALGGIDVLIANAGVSAPSEFADITWQQWRRVLSINLDGVFLTARAAVPRMRANPHGGVILATSSTNALAGHPRYADYNASKAAILALVRTMARELAPTIRVAAVCPGYVLTPMQKKEYSQADLAAVNERLPMGRHAEPAEIAAVFAFLASKDASYITGSPIFVDGGELWC